MSYFLSFSGSQSKFSRAGYLLWNIGSLLERRQINFGAIHAVDLPQELSSDTRLIDQFVDETVAQIQFAKAILLVVPYVKEESLGLLQSLLSRLPTDTFRGKPIVLFVTGGAAGHVALIEQALQSSLLRLGVSAVAARVHLSSSDWIIIGNERPRLSRITEREIADALDLVIRGISTRKPADYSLAEYAG
jgi:NAD(P)H-dependent FMN reductase